jgi:hypothetical protein
MCNICYIYKFVRFTVSLPILVVFAFVVLLSALLQTLVSFNRALIRSTTNNKARTSSQMKSVVFLVLTISLSYGTCAPIVKSVPVCRVTKKSIDLDLPCHDTSCVMYKNLIYQLSGIDEEFNYIYTADFSQIIVYSNNGRVYYTECDIITSYDLNQNQSCSKYVGVAFQYKFEQTHGFMSKQGIKRLSINFEANCVLPKAQIDDKVAISIRNDTIHSIDFEKQPFIETLSLNYTTTYFIHHFQSYYVI